METKKNKKDKLRILCLEDSPADAEIMRESLKDAGFKFKMDITATEKEFLSLIRINKYDIILADFKLPGFDGFSALRWSNVFCPKVPFICVSGTVGEETAVDLLKKGAIDYVLKDKLARLPSAVMRALEEVKEKEALHKAEEKLNLFRALIDQSNDAIEVIDPETGQFLDMNEKACCDLGYNRDELLSMRVFDLDQTIDLSKFLILGEKLKKTGNLLWEGTHRRKDGSVFPVEVNIKYVQLDRNYIVAAVRDISIRKMTEIALIASELRYRRLFESAKDGILILDWETGMIVDVNPFLIKLTGFSLEQFQKKKVWEIGPFKDIIANQDNFLELQKKDYIRYEDLPMETIDGRKIDVEFISNVYEVNHLKVIQCNIRDIRERKQADEALSESEEKYRQLVQSSTDSIVIYIGGKIVFANDASVKLMRAANVEELLGKSVIDFVQPDYKEFVKKRMTEVLKKERSLAFAEEKFIRFDGTEVDVEVKAIPLIYQKKPAVQIISRDITERKQAEKELINSEIINRTLVRHLPQRIFIKDRNSKYILCNDNYSRDLGIEPKEIVGKDDFAYFPKKFAEKYINDDQQVMSEGIIKELVEKYMISGEERWTHVIKIPYRDANDQIIGVLGIFEDITERKRAEEAISNSEERYRTLVEQASDGIFISDENGKYIDVNTRGCDMLGYTLKEILSKSFWDITEKEESTSIPLRIEELRSGKTVVSERHVICKNGSIIPVEISSKMLKDGRLQGIVRDITDRKRAEEALSESEERFRSLYENSTVGIYRTTPDGRILLANPAMVEMLKYSSFDELVKRNLDEIGIEPSYERTQFLDLIEKEGSIKGFESTWKRWDGSLVFVAESARVIRDSQGKTLYYDGVAEDITKRKLAEQHLHLQSAALQAAANAIVITDHEGTIQWANHSFTTLTGCNAEESVGLNPSKLLKSGQPNNEFYQHMWNTILAGKIWNGEIINRRKDGSFYNEEMTITPLLDVNGKVSHFIAIIQDITQRKQTEQILRTISDRQEAILAAVPDIIMEVNNDKVYTWANQAGIEFFGKDVIGKEASWYFDGEQDTYKNVEPIFSGLENIMYVESWQRRQDGQKRLLAWRCRSLKDDIGKVTGILSSARDLTENRKAEMALSHERYLLNTLIDNIPDHIYFKDNEGRFMRISMAHAKLFGLNHPSQAVGKTDYDFFSEEYARSTFADEQEIIRSGKPMTKEERETWSDRPDTWVLTTKMPLRDNDGKFIGTFGISHDITNRKLAEEEIRQLNSDLERRIADRTQQLEEANKELEAFAYSVSHDLRAPLRSIVGFSNIFKEDYGDKVDNEGKHQINVIINNTLRMGQLIDDLLEFSRLGRKEMSKASINMNKMLQEILEELTAQQKDRKIELKAMQLLPCHGDRNMLRQVWFNLVSNALKYSGKKEITQIETGSYIEGGEICYYIRDNGTGFDMKYVDKLFGVFHRLHGINEFEGTGVGLALVKRIVNRHGGRVWAEGKIEIGATFYFSIPK